MLQAILEPGADATVMRAAALVGGKWISEGAQSERVGPFLRRAVSQAPVAGPADIAAVRAYAKDAAPSVARLSPARRAEILERASAAATRNRDGLARLLALELGKPLKDGRGEIDRVADTFAVCAAEARQIGGETLPVAGWARGVGNTAFTYRAPVGVALAITPFNAPANLLAHKLGASFAAGNTTIVKAPPQAPAISAAIVALLVEAGMPYEAVQLLHGEGDVGAALCAAEEVGVISFTGSAATGAAVARAAGAKRLVLELGGNAATIVCEDADVAEAARVCARTGYTNSGQSCISVQRVYVQRSRFAEFLEHFTSAVAALTVGDPLDPAHRRRLDGRRRRRPSASCGGARRPPRPGHGSCSAGPETAPPPRRPSSRSHRRTPRSSPTRSSGRWSRCCPTTTCAEVIDRCNASRFGLQAGLFTRDIDRIITAWRDLEVGGLVVNGSSNFRLDHVPFGGVKDSGFGREAPRWMIEDYTVVKTLMLRGTSLWGDRA